MLIVWLNFFFQYLNEVDPYRIGGMNGFYDILNSEVCERYGKERFESQTISHFAQCISCFMFLI